MVRPLVKLGIVAVVYLAVILAALALDDPLFRVSVSWVKSISSDWSTDPAFKFWENYTNVGIMVIGAISGLYAMWSGPKIKQLIYLDAVLLAMGVIFFMKNLYHALRPCWADKEIPVVVNETDYGNPSGHAASSSVFLFAGLLLYWTGSGDFALTSDEEAAANWKHAFWHNLPVKLAVSLLGLLAVGLIMYTRVYLGAHGLNQVIYGFSLGMMIAFTVLTVYRDELVFMYKKLLNYSEPIRYLPSTLAVLALWVVSVMANNVLYLILRAQDVKLDAATLQHIQTRMSTFTEDTPLKYGLVNSGLFSFVVGMHFGVLFARKYFPQIDPTLVSRPLLVLKRAGRLAFQAAVSFSVPGLIALLWPSMSVPIYAFMKIAFPCALGGFLYFGVSEWAAERWWLTRAGVETKPPAARGVEPLMQMREIVVVKEPVKSQGGL